MHVQKGKNGTEGVSLHPNRLFLHNTFLGAITELRKAAIIFVMSVDLSVRPTAWSNANPTRRIFLRVFFEDMSRKFNFHQNVTKIIGTLHEDLRMSIIICRSILFRMRNVLFQTKFLDTKHIF